MPKPKTSPQNKIKKDAWLALAFATIVLAVNFWAWSLLSPIGVQLETKLQLSSSLLALLIAIPVLLGSIARLFMGVLADRFGAKRMMIAVSLLSATATFYLAFANTFTEYILGALLLGVGGSTFAAGVPYVSRWFPRRFQGTALGIFTLGNAGTAFAGFTSPLFITKFGFSSPFLIAGFSLLATIVMIIFCVKMPQAWKKQPAKTSFVDQLLRAIKHPITLDLAMVYVVTFGALIAFGVYLPVLLKTSYGLTTSDAATRAAGFVLLATCARPVGGWLSDKLGGKFVIKTVLLLIVILASYVAFAKALSISPTITYLSLAGVLGTGCGAVYALIGRLVNSTEVGGVGGVIGAIGGLGGFLPPIILGLTYQFTKSYSLALVGLAISAILVYLYISRQFKQKPIYKKAINLPK